ncbi:hypothetical protein POTOM_059694 [Populus tomentosa]|uniref:RNase H type-1 domain-containing protein n=1 Tax=Populus tomentosa TaxID=118781 RepID=A0A8X7XU18_POPTO|nr:hypothetical protein POTOM_059694 [Populus tomentosa]
MCVRIKTIHSDFPYCALDLLLSADVLKKMVKCKENWSSCSVVSPQRTDSERNVDGSAIGKPGEGRDWRQDFAGKEFVIESDSANVVQWMNEPSIRPWRYKDLFSLAERFSSQISFAHMLREGNHCANVLAKQGVLKQWT